MEYNGHYIDTDNDNIEYDLYWVDLSGTGYASTSWENLQSTPNTCFRPGAWMIGFEVEDSDGNTDYLDRTQALIYHWGSVHSFWGTFWGGGSRSRTPGVSGLFGFGYNLARIIAFTAAAGAAVHNLRNTARTTTKLIAIGDIAFRVIGIGLFLTEGDPAALYGLALNGIMQSAFYSLSLWIAKHVAKGTSTFNDLAGKTNPLKSLAKYSFYLETVIFLGMMLRNPWIAMFMVPSMMMSYMAGFSTGNFATKHAKALFWGSTSLMMFSMFFGDDLSSIIGGTITDFLGDLDLIDAEALTELSGKWGELWEWLDVPLEILTMATTALGMGSILIILGVQEYGNPSEWATPSMISHIVGTYSKLTILTSTIALTAGMFRSGAFYLLPWMLGYVYN